MSDETCKKCNNLNLLYKLPSLKINFDEKGSRTSIAKDRLKIALEHAIAESAAQAVDLRVLLDSLIEILLNKESSRYVGFRMNGEVSRTSMALVKALAKLNMISTLESDINNLLSKEK